MANLKHKRGTKGFVSFPIPGDHTYRELSFVVKRDYELTAERLIQKLKSLGDITTEYDEELDVTNCQVYFEKIDSQDLTIQLYPWDIDSISLTDATDVTTPEGGLFELAQDVQTPFDGFALPESAIRFLQIDARGFPVDIMMITDTINGVVVFRTITLEELKQKLDQIT